MIFRTPLLLVLPVFCAAAAQAAAPAPKPALTGAVTAAAVSDFSDPRKAVESFLSAVDAQNNTTMHQALQIPDNHKNEVETFLSLMAATAKLQKAADTRFGSDATKYFGSRLASSLKTVRAAEMTIQGDTATLTIPPDETAQQPGGKTLLHKVGDTWKIDAASLFGLDSAPPEQTARRVALSAKMTVLTNQFSADIAAGKFFSAVDAYQQYWLKAKEIAGPATAPASTKP